MNKKSISTIFVSICFLFSVYTDFALSEQSNVYYIKNSQIVSDDTVLLLAQTAITDFYVEDNHPLYKTIDGVLYSKDGSVLIAYPSGNMRASYQLIDSVVEIGSYAFYEANVAFIEFPSFDTSRVKKIGDKAFCKCRNLLQICFPNSIEEIGQEAFSDCYEDVVFVVENGSYSHRFFQSQSSSHLVVIQDFSDVLEWAYMDSQLVEYPSSLSLNSDCQIINGVLFQDTTLLAYPLKMRQEEYHIPSEITSVQANLLQNEYLKRLFIPVNCINISNFAQSPLGQMEFISVENGNIGYSSKDGVLYSHDYSVLYCYPQNKNYDTFSPSSEVKRIAPDCFSYSKIRKIILPEGTQSIELFAFFGSMLEEIVIPSTVSYMDIEAFEDCSCLKHIYVEKDSYADKVFQDNADDSYEPLILLIDYAIE